MWAILNSCYPATGFFTYFVQGILQSTNHLITESNSKVGGSPPTYPHLGAVQHYLIIGWQEKPLKQQFPHVISPFMSNCLGKKEGKHIGVSINGGTYNSSICSSDFRWLTSHFRKASHGFNLSAFFPSRSAVPRPSRTFTTSSREKLPASGTWRSAPVDKWLLFSRFDAWIDI